MNKKCLTCLAFVAAMLASACQDHEILRMEEPEPEQPKEETRCELLLTATGAEELVADAVTRADGPNIPSGEKVFV